MADEALKELVKWLLICAANIRATKDYRDAPLVWETSALEYEGRADALESALSELARLRGEREWRDISTAPWSGPPVLLWKPSTSEHYVAARIRGEHGPGWCTPDGYEIFRATHWQPLPAPPVQSHEEKRG